MRRRFDRCRIRRDFPDPAITKARHGANGALLVAGVAKAAPNLDHGMAEQGVADFDAAPHRGDQFITTNRTLAMLDQIRQALECSCGKRDQNIVPMQFACG